MSTIEALSLQAIGAAARREWSLASRLAIEVALQAPTAQGTVEAIESAIMLLAQWKDEIARSPKARIVRGLRAIDGGRE